MNEKQLLTHVRERADLESTDEARAATEATLRVLGSRIIEPEAEDLAPTPGSVRTVHKAGRSPPPALATGRFG